MIGASIMSGVLQLNDRTAVTRHEQVAENRIHFWRVIAGQETASSPTVDNQLANDLKVALEKDQLAEFRGTSNQYGGISEALGSDPFAGESCKECGPLSGEMLVDLITIRNGDVDKLVASERVEPWHFEFWRVGFSSLLVLLFFSPVVIWERVREHRLQRKMRECYGDSMNDLDEVDRVLAQVSLRWGDHPQVKALQGARDDLVRDMRASVRTNDEIDLETRVKSMERRLSMVKDHVTARDSTLREMENQ
jgi:hypothetical protein